MISANSSPVKPSPTKEGIATPVSLSSRDSPSRFFAFDQTDSPLKPCPSTPELVESLFVSSALLSPPSIIRSTSTLTPLRSTSHVSRQLNLDHCGFESDSSVVNSMPFQSPSSSDTPQPNELFARSLPPLTTISSLKRSLSPTPKTSKTTEPLKSGSEARELGTSTPASAEIAILNRSRFRPINDTEDLDPLHLIQETVETVEEKVTTKKRKTVRFTNPVSQTINGDGDAFCNDCNLFLGWNPGRFTCGNSSCLRPQYWHVYAPAEEDTVEHCVFHDVVCEHSSETYFYERPLKLDGRLKPILTGFYINKGEDMDFVEIECPVAQFKKRVYKFKS